MNNNNIQQNNMMNINFIKQKIKEQVDLHDIEKLEKAVEIHRNPLSSTQEVRKSNILYKKSFNYYYRDKMLVKLFNNFKTGTILLYIACI